MAGGSEQRSKPGGKLLQNLLEGGYSGDLMVLNPGKDSVQGVEAFAAVSDLPVVPDLAILAVAADLCVPLVRDLAQRGTRAFIVVSAGFGEEGPAGRALEEALLAEVEAVDGVLIGPNCIGVLTPVYNGVFTAPVPRLDAGGCDFVSGSGATAVFILEAALPKGLTFASILTVGNSVQVGVEEVLEHWDVSYKPGVSAPIKLIYVEDLKNPDKFLRHAASLIRKGCCIAAIKSGTSEAGQRATSSHTGALASTDSAVEALFRKAGVVRCAGREELVAVASVFRYKPLQGKRLAIVTQAGGPGVMLADALSEGGLQIPALGVQAQTDLKGMLNAGAAVGNPVDILATGTAEQLRQVLAYCDGLEGIDGMIVIFGSTGLTQVFDAFEVIHRQVLACKKPVFPILPSTSSAHAEVQAFLARGHVNFPDEVVLGRALGKVWQTPRPAREEIFMEGVDLAGIRRLIDGAEAGWLGPAVVNALLRAAGIPVVPEGVAHSKKELVKLAGELGYPLALKAVGLVHKSDVGGVTLNIRSEAHLLAEYGRMLKIEGVEGVLVQKMAEGMELFIGGRYEPRYGHVLVVGLGGVFVEMLNDFAHGLAPLTMEEAASMIRSLKSHRVIQGMRGREGVDEELFAEILVRLSTLLRYATEIKELDLNPLIGNKAELLVVDARMLLHR
ncbi:acetate--CoA ligase family protein [Geofilum rhodophaeum]|uniref:acetate--CoA ligase family protein n=1 Tax=Geofilum rhodophaeum TaxID=1965019 RepID=UPI0037436BB1